MPMHDCTCVGEHVFRPFRTGWLCELMGVLNNGLLPEDSFALVEGAPDAPESRRLVVRQVTSGLEVAVLELASPGHESSQQAYRDFLSRVRASLSHGVYVTVIDPFPPTARDPEDFHRAIWSEIGEPTAPPTPDRPLTLASDAVGDTVRAYVEPLAAGEAMPAVPLFLTPELPVPLPLEATYATALRRMPPHIREMLGA